MSVLYGGVEGGGAKFVCCVGTGPDDLRATTQIPTTTPDETIGLILEFFKAYLNKEPLKAIGIASFGPVDLNQKSPTYGYITTTPKAGWSDTNLVGEVCSALDIPVAFNTDVNASALGEYTWGVAKGLRHFIYLTVGTGFGGGGIINGELMQGLIHPEMGHILIPHDRNVDPYPGACPFHGDCLEGLISAKAIEMRWGRSPESISPNHPAWLLEADYLAKGLVNFICALSPQRIVIGGGIMKQPQLLLRVRKMVVELLNGYVSSPDITDHIDNYIVPPKLGDLSGALGAIILAQRLEKSS